MKTAHSQLDGFLFLHECILDLISFSVILICHWYTVSWNYRLPCGCNSCFTIFSCSLMPPQSLPNSGNNSIFKTLKLFPLMFQTIINCFVSCRTKSFFSILIFWTFLQRTVKQVSSTEVDFSSHSLFWLHVLNHRIVMFGKDLQTNCLILSFQVN